MYHYNEYNDTHYRLETNPSSVDPSRYSLLPAMPSKRAQGKL